MLREQNILGEDWHTLIILDACRFDFFEKVYEDYLDGDLEKMKSKGSNTGEWLVKTFPERYDFTYISANPYINSFNLSLKECQHEYTYPWTAIEHFTKIIDVWDSGWAAEIGTVPPENVNSVIAGFEKVRKIIHYIQPHWPYLSYGGTLGIRSDVKETINSSIFGSIQRRIKSKITKAWKSANPKKVSQYERIYRNEGLEKLHYYYEDNLRRVLKCVSHLIPQLNGSTIITSDHGEAFGESGIWGHPVETDIPVLVEIPWLKVKI